jgi:peptidoglycan hydrolase-like protein with peptidoglycan-binding domain
MNTIRKGSTGPDVKKWQIIIGVNADGIFGPATESATKAWQSSRKLVADGVVGPATWSLALGTTVTKTVQKTAQAPTDIKAYEIAKKAAPELTERELQYVLTVARGEGFYGLGWANPSEKTIIASQRHGLTGYEGKDSKNWGAEQGTGSAGSFMHVDYRADGSEYVGKYKRWNTDEEGFNSMKRIILGGGLRKAAGAAEIKKAINEGNLSAAVAAQRANGYFELALDKYLAAVTRNYDILSANIGWKKVLTPKGSTILKILGAIGLAGIVAVGMYTIRKS